MYHPWSSWFLWLCFHQLHLKPGQPSYTCPSFGLRGTGVRGKGELCIAIIIPDKTMGVTCPSNRDQGCHHPTWRIHHSVFLLFSGCPFWVPYFLNVGFHYDSYGPFAIFSLGSVLGNHNHSCGFCFIYLCICTSPLPVQKVFLTFSCLFRVPYLLTSPFECLRAPHIQYV